MKIPRNRLDMFLQAANSFADESRTLAKEIIGTNFKVFTKSDKSIVTEADTKIEVRLRERIRDLFPDHGVIGEEFPPTNPESSYQWILDPIDGTEEFVNGVPTYGTIISLEYNTLPIVGLIDHPALNVRVTATKGGGTFLVDQKVILNDRSSQDNQLRLGISKRLNFSRFKDEEVIIFDSIVEKFPNLRIFDSCMAYSLAAMGSLDVMIDFNVRHWDISACQLLCEEAGGSFQMLNLRKPKDGSTYYSAVFGRKSAVSRVLDKLNSLKFSDI